MQARRESGAWWSWRSRTSPGQRLYRPAGLRLAGLLLGLEGFRFAAPRCPGAGGRRPVVEDGDGPPRRIAYAEIESVLVESNRKLDLSYRSNGLQRCLVFQPPLRYIVFLQHFLRQRAFGNPYARYRGSNRAEVLPE